MKAQIEHLEKENKFLKEIRIVALEKENKNLKEKVSELEDVSEDYDLLSKDFIALGEENESLEEKITKLQIEIRGLMGERDGLKMAVEELHDEIVEQDKEYKHISEIALKTLEENKKLKSDLADQYDGANGLHDEIGYWKNECKKLKAELDKYKAQYEHSMGDDELIYEEGLYD